jgi:hypothetical protein
MLAVQEPAGMEMTMAMPLPMPMPSPERNPPPRKWIKQWYAICCFLFLFFFNTLSWTKFHKPLGHLFFQIHLLFEVCCVFKLSTFIGKFCFFLGLPQSEGMFY